MFNFVIGYRSLQTRMLGEDKKASYNSLQLNAHSYLQLNTIHSVQFIHNGSRRTIAWLPSSSCFSNAEVDEGISYMAALVHLNLGDQACLNLKNNLQKPRKVRVANQIPLESPQ